MRTARQGNRKQASKSTFVPLVRVKESHNQATGRAATSGSATLVRCKTKQKTLTRPGESSGWLQRHPATVVATRRAIVAAEKWPSAWRDATESGLQARFEISAEL